MLVVAAIYNQIEVAALPARGKGGAESSPRSPDGSAPPARSRRDAEREEKKRAGGEAGCVV